MTAEWQCNHVAIKSVVVAISTIEGSRLNQLNSSALQKTFQPQEIYPPKDTRCTAPSITIVVLATCSRHTAKSNRNVSLSAFKGVEGKRHEP